MLTKTCINNSLIKLKVDATQLKLQTLLQKAQTKVQN